MNIKKWLPFVFIVFLLSMIHPAYLQGAAKREIIINTDILNVRAGPGLSYPILGKVKKGESYSIQNVEGEWYEIKFENNKGGWVASWLVEEQFNQGEIKRGKIMTDKLRLRSGPGTSYAIKGFLGKHTTVQILSAKNDWYEVSTSAGKGWIHQNYVSLIDEENIYGKVIADVLNVRREPSITSDVMGKLFNHEKITVLSIEKDWLQIQFNREIGWVHKDYVKIEFMEQEQRADLEKKEEKPMIEGIHGMITASSLYIRDKASLDGTIISTVKEGETYPIHDMENNWYKLEFAPNQFGWAAGWFVKLQKREDTINETVLILYDGTNIRSNPDQTAEVISRAHEGDEFPLVSVHDDWYEIQLENGKTGFVAGWLVSLFTQQTIQHNEQAPLLGKKILIDPGHGGKDNGATGASGTLEKDLTLKTSQLLYQKLQNLGATVFLTRHTDQSLSLRRRVNMAHYQDVDAFISIHYDSIDDTSVHGMTTYYFYPWQKPLAVPVHQAIQQYGLKDRGVRFGNYHVLRENQKTAILMELGYISNPTEEQLVLSDDFQEQITSGIAQGLVTYFQIKK